MVKSLTYGPVAGAVHLAAAAAKAYAANKRRKTGGGKGGGKSKKGPMDKYFKPDYRFPKRPPRGGKAAGAGSRNTGPYVGKVRKGKKLSRKADKFITHGFTYSHEMNGSVDDPDVSYLGVSGIAGYSTIELMCQVILRKLFEKSGAIVNGVDTELVSVLVTVGANVVAQSSFGWRLALKSVDQQTRAITWITYDLAVGDTIGSICGKNLRPGGSLSASWADLINIFRDYSAGGGRLSTINVREPESIQLLRHDAYGVASNEIIYRVEAVLNLREEHVVTHSKTMVKMQNRSLSVEGSDDADAVDSNPCRLVKYEFFGNPRTRTINYSIAVTTSDNFPAPDANNGILPIRAQSLETNLREPPPGKYFWNCNKCATDVLNPGEVRSDSFSYMKNQRLLVYLRSLRHSTSAGGNAEQTINAPFRLYALEDMINLNAAQNIRLAYEVQRNQKMYLFTSKVRASVEERYATSPTTL